MASYDECKGYLATSIKNNYVESGVVGSINEFGEHLVNISTSVKN